MPLVIVDSPIVKPQELAVWNEYFLSNLGFINLSNPGVRLPSTMYCRRNQTYTVVASLLSITMATLIVKVPVFSGLEADFDV